jgi:hypothetical protein
MFSSVYEIEIARVGLLMIVIIAFYTVIKNFNTVSVNKSFEPNNFLPVLTADKITFLSAIAFGGVSGVLNLVQSNWVQSKGYGINSSKELQYSKIDFSLNESKQNWQKWFLTIAQEHFIFFLFR